jgi:NADH:ubiquinone oxidoreductase subunit
MGLGSFFGRLSPAAGIAARIFARAKKVGVDPYGNIYYAAPPRKGYRHERRFVDYNGPVDASRIPPEWHGWMHHQTDVIPDSDTLSFRRRWQKPHKPNLTGTKAAYRPPGSLLKDGKRPTTTGDYEAWRPPE